MNLYEKYGGFGAVNKVVMAFYDRLLDSDELGPYFDNIDMARLIDHQTKFVATLLGGPASFTDEQLISAHRTTGVTDGHFDELKTILFETLTDHGFEKQDAEAVMEAIEDKRATVVRTTE
ncbi:MAG: group 1 truncated hemoglobin [Granulosicoccus sp.]|nr:group 1 truncated hemoglobin [Granulosicoccus sp.]